MMAVNVSLIRLIPVVSSTTTTEIENASLTYTRRLMGHPTERTVTDANAQRTHLTRRRTQTIAQGTKGGLQDLWKQPRAQPETLLYRCVLQR